MRRTKGEWFAVDSINEARELRSFGIRTPIIVIGYVPLARLSELPALNVRYLVSSEETIRALARVKKGPTVRVHLKVDTGTSRQGVLPEKVLALARTIRRHGFVLEGVAMHFANIEDTENPTYADLQLERFLMVVADLRAAGFSVPIVHAASTAAVMTRVESLASAARVGIGIYGINPSPLTGVAFRRAHRSLRLRPVLSLRTRVALVKRIPKCTPVGYGLTERVTRATVLAVLPVGYADGYDRRFSSIGRVLIRGKKCRIVGRICMNMCMVDVTDIPKVCTEEIATLIGSERGVLVSAEELGRLSGIIEYELFARLSPLIPRYLTP